MQARLLHQHIWRYDVLTVHLGLLRGWLVVLPARHVTSLVEVGEAAAAELGTLLHRLAVALEQVTGCVKTYQMQFSEAEGFSHLHVHVVPRIRDQPAELRGPRVFGHLVADEAQWVSEDERDRVALAVRAAYAG